MIAISDKKFSNQDFLELYDQGLNDKEIAEELGVHRVAVNKRRNKLGLESNYDRKRPKEWSKEKIIKKIRELAEEIGRTPVVKDDEALANATRRYFGSWNNGLRAAGLESRGVRGTRVWTKERVVMELKELANKLGKSPSQIDLREQGRIDLLMAGVREFGSWNEAKEAAGLEMYPAEKVEDQEIIDSVKKEGVVSLSQLAEKFGVTDKAISKRVRKIDGVKKYYTRVYRGRGSSVYKESDLFDPDYRDQTYVYTDSIEFAEFFADKILKIELNEELDRGMKQSITHYIRNAFPDEVVKYLREKYIKG